MKDKVKKFEYEAENNVLPESNTIKNEALSALAILGFNKAAAGKVVDNLLKQGDYSVETLIKEALKVL